MLNGQYTGRWEFDGDKAESHWGGAYVTFKYSGSKAEIELLKPANLFIKKDDEEDIYYPGASGTLVITHSMKGIHTLRIAARFHDDEIALAGVKTDGMILPVETDRPLIEFIGDSITCGDRTTNGNLSAYGWIACEALHCDHVQIAYCGITLTDGYYFGYDGAPKTGMEKQYFLLKQPNSQGNRPYEFFAKEPDIIVVNLGTNDNSFQIPEADFENHYENFLRKLRAVHPASLILALRTFGGYYEEPTKKAVEKLNDPKCRFVDTAGWLHVNDYTDGCHPNDAGHIKASEKLKNVLEDIL